LLRQARNFAMSRRQKNTRQSKSSLPSVSNRHDGEDSEDTQIISKDLGSKIQGRRRFSLTNSI